MEQGEIKNALRAKKAEYQEVRNNYKELIDKLNGNVADKKRIREEIKKIQKEKKSSE